MAVDDEASGVDSPGATRVDSTDIHALPQDAQAGQADAQSMVASTASDVDITVDREGAAIGDTITVSWEIRGGTNPRVSGMSIRSAITDGPLMFWRDQAQWLPFNGGPSGFVSVTVPNGGNRMFVVLSVADGSRMRLVRSDYFSVSGFTGLRSGEWGEVEDTRTGQFGVGYFVNGSVKKNWFLLEQLVLLQRTGIPSAWVDGAGQGHLVLLERLLRRDANRVGGSQREVVLHGCHRRDVNRVAKARGSLVLPHQERRYGLRLDPGGRQVVPPGV